MSEEYLMDNYLDDIFDLHEQLKYDYIYQGMFNTSFSREFFRMIARNIEVKGTPVQKENDVSEPEM